MGLESGMPMSWYELSVTPTAYSMKQLLRFLSVPITLSVFTQMFSFVHVEHRNFVKA